MSRKVKEIKETPGYFNTTAVPPGNVFPNPDGASTVWKEHYNMKSKNQKTCKDCLYLRPVQIMVHSKRFFNEGNEIPYNDTIALYFCCVHPPSSLPPIVEGLWSEEAIVKNKREYNLYKNYPAVKLSTPACSLIKSTKPEHRSLVLGASDTSNV